VTAFQDLRVVEVAGSEAGAYFAKLFADLGAQVVRVEPPGGDPRRSDPLDPSRPSAAFAYLDTSKVCIELDLAAAVPGTDAAAFRRLVEEADIVVESAAPGPLVPLTAGIQAPRLVRVYLSPFGIEGPYSAFRSNPFTDEAIGGHMYLNGEPGREPLARPGLHAHFQAATQAFIGAMAALFARERTGLGQTVEVSHFEGLVSLHQHTTSMWINGGHILKREGNRQPGPFHPVGNYRCRDGYVHLSLPGGAMVEPFLAATGLAYLLDDPRFATDFARAMHKDAFDEAIAPWLLEHSAAEIIELGQSVLTPVGPVPGFLEVFEDEHLRARGSWVELAGEQRLKVPRGPFRVQGHPFEPKPGRRADGRWEGWPGRASSPPRSGGEAAALAGPLDGVRVIDLTRVWAGPLAGRLLADLGADVILVERPTGRGKRAVPPEAAQITHLYPDNDVGERPWNRVAGFNKLMRNRRGLTLDLRDDTCREALRRLVRSADVILENFSPRVMAQLGFSDGELRELNPRIIHASMPGFGATGPKRDWVAFGPLIEASSGLSSIMGYPGSGPYRSGIAWPDPVAGMNAAAGVLVALWDRDHGPAGDVPHVEVAMIEAMLSFVGDQVTEAQQRGANPPRRGNRDPRHAPQGCYPCAGGDRWIAISVTCDEEWRRLHAVAGLDGALAELTLAERQERHDEIDSALERWTRAHEPHGLMRRLQDQGIIAAVVSDARDLVEDPHLAARDAWARIDHPDVGPRMYPGTPIRLSGTPVRYRLPAPTFGQHNEEILQGELGFSAEEVAAMRDRGAIVDAPPE
jgi:crotonobetainyl-CoA:carnitine CoA-transferase CaiB-like acyl-CoA transferase